MIKHAAAAALFALAACAPAEAPSPASRAEAQEIVANMRAIRPGVEIPALIHQNQIAILIQPGGHENRGLGKRIAARTPGQVYNGLAQRGLGHGRDDCNREPDRASIRFGAILRYHENPAECVLQLGE